MGNMSMFFDYFTAFGMCLGWNSTIVASETITNFVIGISFIGISLQLLYNLIFRPDHVWVISDVSSVKLIFCVFLLFAGFHHIVYMVSLYFPIYYTLATIDVITMIFSLVSVLIVQKIAILYRPRKKA